MKEETPALTQPPPSTHVPNKDDAQEGSARAAEPSAGGVPGTAAAGAGAGEPTRSPAAWWALLLALVALAGAGWAIWQVRDARTQAGALREELAQRLAEGETGAVEARGIVRQQQEVIASLQGKLGVLDAKVEATEGQAAALEALYQEFSRSREDGVIAEVEQAVVLAAQQLQIAGNVEAALIALQEAEARLAIHDRGQLAALRRALARDIDTLKLQPSLDVSGLGLRLERLLERADALPLAFEGPLPAEAAVGGELAPGEDGGLAGWVAGAWRATRAIAGDVWHEIRALVRVERLDQTDPVLLAPAQSTFLRENLKIRLLTARLALLARDGRTYEADLAQARAWVERFFDLRDERVQHALLELKELAAVKVRYEPPSLTETFTALRNVQVRGGRPAAETGRAPATLPPPVPAGPEPESTVADPALPSAAAAETGAVPDTPSEAPSAPSADVPPAATSAAPAAAGTAGPTPAAGE